MLITGGNRGLGLEMVKEMKAQGAEVVVVGRSSSPELDEVQVGTRRDCRKAYSRGYKGRWNNSCGNDIVN